MNLPRMRITGNVDEKDMFLFEINGQRARGIYTLNTLKRKFALQGSDWDVKVIGRWRERNSRQFEKY